MTALRLPSSLPGDLEDLVHQTIGCCIAVHRELGPGLLEKVYPRAIAAELKVRNILVLEVKSVERLAPIHVAPVINYLRLTGARVGLLVNFNVPVLKQGLRRIVL